MTIQRTAFKPEIKGLSFNLPIHRSESYPGNDLKVPRLVAGSNRGALMLDLPRLFLIFEQVNDTVHRFFNTFYEMKV